eukprot:1702841-Pyramimonas_sp.AAC.1
MLSSLLTACARARPVPLDRAADVFERQLRAGIKPNAAVFSALLTLCAKVRGPSQSVAGRRE